jgi:hypothetical protein
MEAFDSLMKRCIGERFAESSHPPAGRLSPKSESTDGNVGSKTLSTNGKTVMADGALCRYGIFHAALETAPFTDAV